MIQITTSSSRCVNAEVMKYGRKGFALLPGCTWRSFLFYITTIFATAFICSISNCGTLNIWSKRESTQKRIFDMELWLLLPEPNIAGGLRVPAVIYEDESAEDRASRCRDHAKYAILVPGIKFSLFVLSHDDNSEKSARLWCSCRPWARPIRIYESSRFFESIVYQNLSYYLGNNNEWRTLDYLAFASYRSVQMLPVEKLQSHLFLMVHGKYDVVPLMNYGFPLLSQAINGHTDAFRETWDTLLLTMGFTIEGIRQLDNSEVFLRNSFIVTPTTIEALSVFMKAAMSVASGNTTVSTLMEGDAQYKVGSRRVAQRIFSTPYYQFHPFIFERLPVFYFHSNGYKVYGTLYK